MAQIIILYINIDQMNNYIKKIDIINKNAKILFELGKKITKKSDFNVILYILSINKKYDSCEI